MPYNRLFFINDKRMSTLAANTLDACTAEGLTIREAVEFANEFLNVVQSIAVGQERKIAFNPDVVQLRFSPHNAYE